jgi:hypothetical protein
MKSKHFITLTLAIGLIVGSLAFKVDVCHNVDHNPVTISVSLPGAAYHLFQHSEDSLGSCGSADDDFSR